MHTKTAITVASFVFSGISIPIYAESIDSSKSISSGLYFNCSNPKSGFKDVSAYLKMNGINNEWLDIAYADNSFRIKLSDEYQSNNTFDIFKNQVFKVSSEQVELLDGSRNPIQVSTVSKKEILLALMHVGRKTLYDGSDCGLQAIKDDVGVRQTTVAWTQNIEFEWPDGGPASWNTKYWERGTPHTHVDLHAALIDAVSNSKSYGIGCYTAAKMLISASTLDYYKRIKKDAHGASIVQSALMSDQDPLVDIEPGSAWYFESGQTHEDNHIPGKILDLKWNVSPGNFVPGDWIYLLNPDPVSYEKTGYEGSNAIYLGGGNFSDYYNDNGKKYPYKQKVHEVYQWRNGVFSRTRDAHKVKPLTENDYLNLSKSPSEGGLLLPYRLVHRNIQSMANRIN